MAVIGADVPIDGTLHFEAADLTKACFVQGKASGIGLRGVIPSVVFRRDVEWNVGSAIPEVAQCAAFPAGKAKIPSK